MGRLTTPPGPVIGVPDASNAGAGIVGEFVEANSIATPVTLVINVPASVAMITLSPGDWDVSACSVFTAMTPTLARVSAGLSTSPIILPSSGDYVRFETPAIAGEWANVVPTRRFSIASSTSFHLVIVNNQSNNLGAGVIRARRVR